jgi:DNA-binding LacI/PurR family transcriptional regulator
MAEISGRANIRQVAALAGVSHQTVSRVLNGHASIRPATRDRVLAAIEELDYRPNQAARALATRKTDRIGVIVDSAVEYGPNSTLRGLERAARAAGYSVTSATVGDDDPLGPSVAFDHLLSQGIDALCVIAPRSSSLDRLRKSSMHMPALVVTAAKDDTFLTVSVDQELGAALAVRHLIDLGHRRIAHVAGPLDWLDARARHRAWQTEIASAGLDELDVVVGDWTAGFGYEVAHVPGRLPDCTAVFAANDQIALGLIHGFSERGIRVPADVSIVGFDDLPESKHFLPPLTTVRQDFRALGERVVEVLHAALEGSELDRRSIIAPVLIVRESTGPPPGS